MIWSSTSITFIRFCDILNVFFFNCYTTMFIYSSFNNLKSNFAWKKKQCTEMNITWLLNNLFKSIHQFDVINIAIKLLHFTYWTKLSLWLIFCGIMNSPWIYFIDTQTFHPCLFLVLSWNNSIPSCLCDPSYRAFEPRQLLYWMAFRDLEHVLGCHIW